MFFKTYDEAYAALAKMSVQANLLWRRHDEGDPLVTAEVAAAATRRVQRMSKQVMGFKGSANDPIYIDMTGAGVPRR